MKKFTAVMFASALLIAPRPSSAAGRSGFFLCFGPAFSTLRYDPGTVRAFDGQGVAIGRRLGFQVGAGYEIALGPRLSLMPAILYSTSGDKLTSAAGKGETVLTGTKVPIELKLAFRGPFLFAGPYLGYLSSAKMVFDDGSSERITNINKFHYGISAGAGFELALRGIAVMLKFGYQYGLSNIAKTDFAEDPNRASHDAFTIQFVARI